MIHGVVMAGGSGTRFWPLSRRKRPKQLLPITGGGPMVAETVARVRSVIPPERIWVVTHRDQAEGIRAAIPEVPEGQILAEPAARNTCACAALAAVAIAARDPDATLVMMPADHDIRPPEEFAATLLAAAESVQRHGGLMVFGIKPSYPATGYGYIHRGPVLHEARGIDVREVRGFREKPNAGTAAGFLATGEYLWNSGIFVWKAARIRAAIGEFEPEIGAPLEAVAHALEPAGPRVLGEKGVAALAEAYAKIPAVSVDIGVLERARDVRLIEIGYRWSDVGSFDALDDLLPTDESGHRVVTPEGSTVLSLGSQNCLVHSSAPHAIALVGVEDLIVVHTPDATLVCRRGHAENVKQVVDQLTKAKRDDLL